jgi:hypothetical protein
MKVSEMTPFAINDTIADALFPEHGVWGSNIIVDEAVFNPCFSRDDIARAEMALDEELRDKYITELLVETEETHFWGLITATPRQRAEALVKTLGGETDA